MDTSLLDVDLQPDYVRISVKDKVTQLSMPEEILVERSTVQRSATTG
jgi:protein TilB